MKMPNIYVTFLPGNPERAEVRINRKSAPAGTLTLATFSSMGDAQSAIDLVRRCIELDAGAIEHQREAEPR